jgi:serine/threonine protein kinase
MEAERIGSLTGRAPFAAPTLAETLENNAAGVINFEPGAWQGLTAEARDLVFRMTQVDPQARSSARECLSHPWFRTACDVSRPTVSPTEPAKEDIKEYVHSLTSLSTTALKGLLNIPGSKEATKLDLVTSSPCNYKCEKPNLKAIRPPFPLTVSQAN